jgi:hypothetical protein
MNSTIKISRADFIASEGNTEFNECYMEIRLFGILLDSYAGKREFAEAWAEERCEELYQHLKTRGQR